MNKERSRLPYKTVVYDARVKAFDYYLFSAKSKQKIAIYTCDKDYEEIKVLSADTGRIQISTDWLNECGVDIEDLPLGEF